jgi:outer membrane protein
VNHTAAYPALKQVKLKIILRKLSYSIAFSSIFSANALAEDLMQVYTLAFDFDPILKQARSARESIDENVNITFSRFLPHVNAEANTFGNRDDKAKLSDRAEGFNTHDYNINLDQSLFDNKNYVNYRISKINVSRADAELNATLQNLIIRVADAYFRTLAAIDKVGFAKAEKKAIGRQLDQAQRRYEVGIIAITDVLEAQAGFDNANAEVILAENELLVTKEVLRELTGKYIDQLAPLAQKIPLDPPSPEDINHWTDMAINGNYTLLAAQEGTYSAQENINLQRSGHYPTLGLRASYGYRSNNGPGSFIAHNKNEGRIGLNLSIPIYEGNAVTSRTRQAQYDFQQSQERYSEILNSTEKSTRSNYLSVISEVSRVKALKQAVISNESGVKATEAGFEVGTRTIVDVLNVQRDLFRAKQEHSNARYIYILNILRLKQDSGELDRLDLERVNQWLGNNVQKAKGKV